MNQSEPKTVFRQALKPKKTCLEITRNSRNDPMAKIARQRRRVEKQPDKVDMGYTHDVTLYNVNLFTGTSFQQRAYVSPPQMASRDCFFFLHFCTQTEKNVARTVDDPRAR